MGRDGWREAMGEPGLQRALGAGLAVGLPLVLLLPSFFHLLGDRPGRRPPDPLLDLIPPMEVALATFLVLYGAVLAGLFHVARRPRVLVRMVHAYAVLLALRMLTMYAVTFEPPEGIIPLVDPVTALFYPGKEPFLKDLFFSGHTATPLLFAFAAGTGPLRRWLVACAAVVGALVLVQHVHYTVDVIAAPLFAALAWWLSARTMGLCGAPVSAGAGA